MTEFNPTTPDVIIYYNSACETSRNTLALIRITGIKPHIIEYLKLPLNRDLLLRLVRRMGVSLRSIQREKGTPYSEFQLERPDLTVDELLDAIGSHPILINRPIVLTPRGVRLCWPSEVVLEILPIAQLGAFTKEDGDAVIDARSHHIV